jgi:hypothetical protein
MKNVALKFNDISVDVFDDGWLCICDGENLIFLRPEYFKKLLEAINYTRCCAELKDDLQFERKSSARVFNNQTGMWEFI